MIRPTTALLFAILIAASSTGLGAQSSQDGFDTMAQPTEDQIECKAPRPPKDLAETAYIRNGYRAILRIIATEKWQETGNCDCQITEFTWEDVIERSTEFVTSDNPRLPFNVVDLDKRATTFEEARSEACSAD
jgi:hypothetical protein